MPLLLHFHVPGNIFVRPMSRSASLSVAPATRQARDILGDDADVRADEAARGVESPVWKVHDRTHIECGIDWALAEGATKTELEWEAYFFAPESLRLDRRTYGKQGLYTDLRSYVRLAVPDATFAELAGEPLADLSKAVVEGDAARCVYEMRFFACQVRAASARVRNELRPRLAGDDDLARAAACAEASAVLEDVERAVVGLREVLREARRLPEPAPSAARWVDEDVSRMVETLCGELTLVLRRRPAPKSLEQTAERIAVAEARYRKDEGLAGVAWAGIRKSDVEHLEFRRHVLKRFTASVLWLSPELRDPGQWVVEGLYAVAAGVAMAFAVVAAVWNGMPDSDRLWMWGAIAVLAYMAKDRIKASLQQVFSRLVSRRFPDRRWLVRNDAGGAVLGRADERVGIIPFERVPEDVLAVRRRTREHPFEEEARPETVLWHRKDVTLDAEAIAKVDRRVDAMREILRLDLHQWLVHTDDPKRRIVFADPESGEVCSAVAPRVYNIGIVYRLRRKGERAPWHRVRVVVTRQGIRRIDRIC